MIPSSLQKDLTVSDETTFQTFLAAMSITRRSSHPSHTTQVIPEALKPHPRISLPQHIDLTPTTPSDPFPFSLSNPYLLRLTLQVKLPSTRPRLLLPPTTSPIPTRSHIISSQKPTSGPIFRPTHKPGTPRSIHLHPPSPFPPGIAENSLKRCELTSHQALHILDPLLIRILWEYMCFDMPIYINV